MGFSPRPSFGDAHRGYDPNQPRVPAGNSDGGQWTSTGGSGDLDEVSAAKRRRPGRAPEPQRWPAEMLAIFEALRKRELLNDLFGNKLGVVARLEFNDEEVWGVNSESWGFRSADDSRARRMRSALLEKYPDVMTLENIGHHPNDALFHAETTVLLRAASKNGGTLAI